MKTKLLAEQSFYCKLIPLSNNNNIIIHQPQPFPVTYSIPPHTFRQLICIGVYVGVHVTQTVLDDWSQQVDERLITNIIIIIINIIFLLDLELNLFLSH